MIRNRHRPRTDRRREPPPTDVIRFDRLAALHRLLSAPRWARLVAELAEAEASTTAPDPAEAGSR